MGLPQARQRIERSVAERRRLLEAHRGRLVRDARALLNADELRVCTEGEPGYAEDVFADRELADSGADCNDLPGELATEDPLSRPADAKHQAAEETAGPLRRLASRVAASNRFTVVAWTFTRTSPAVGTGRLTSSSRRTSGGPYRL